MTTGKSEERTKWEVSNRMILYVLYKHVINSFTIFIQLTALGGIKFSLFSTSVVVYFATKQ